MAVLTAFQMFDVDPKSFDLMPRHQQTEMVKLVSERGIAWADIASAIGRTTRDVVQIATAVHGLVQPVVPASDDETPGATKLGPRVVKKAGRPAWVQLAILKTIAEYPDCRRAISRDALSDLIGASRNSIDYAIASLVDASMIVMTKPAAPGVGTEWQVTEAGQAMLRAEADGHE